MTEVLCGHGASRDMENAKTSSTSVRSGPKYEAFLMTGEKMISLDPNISPRYAEIYHEQLPPGSMKRQVTPNKRGPFDDLPSSMMQNRIGSRRFNIESAMPASQSDEGLGKQKQPSESEIDVIGQQSSVTVNTSSYLNGTTEILSDMAVASISSEEYPNDATKDFEIINHESTEMNGVSLSAPCSPARSSYESNLSSSVRCPSPPEPDKKSDVDVVASSRLAKRLFTLDGFRKTDVASHLSKVNDFGMAVAEEYCALFNFTGIRLDDALREFLSRFCLTGESQERVRIIEHFANRYHLCNPTLFSSTDQVLALTCAILLLNSDLHGPNVGKRMSSREFIDSLSQTEYIYDRSFLKTLYATIKEMPIKWAEDDADEKSESTTEEITKNVIRKVKNRLMRSSSSVGGIGDHQIEYKSGWVIRKCVYDRDGSRTPFGRRAWRMFYARLRGMVLYLHKDEEGFQRGRYETFNNAIMLHHSLAERPRNYMKRQHVFRLRTANLGEFLFQTSDNNEVGQWIDAINYVAAVFSSPALPAPVSSQRNIFHKPLLPSAASSLSIPEQLRMHEEKELEMQQRLEILMKEAPPLKAKGQTVQDFFFKERYLYQEKERYQLYAEILRRRLSIISQSHSSCHKVDVASTKFYETVRSTSFNFLKNMHLANSVPEDPEAEARAEQAEQEDFRIDSQESLSSAEKSSYKEAISHCSRNMLQT